MSCTCNHGHTHGGKITVNAELKRDPTRTSSLRKRFEQEFGARFLKLKDKIRREIDANDGFGLRTNRFNFPRSADKISSFMAWLKDEQYSIVIGVPQGANSANSARRMWATTYIDAAYNRGIAQSAAQMRSAGASIEQSWIDTAFNRPIHADRVGLAYMRTFSELQGITDAMDQQISRVLADGLARGANPLEIANMINDRVDKVGLTRARMLARTEVISAHAEASLNSYEEAGIEGVEVEAEHTTAGDGDVCPECQALEGMTYKIDEARGIIPVHPNCRCAFIPKIKNGRDIVLR